MPECYPGIEQTQMFAVLSRVMQSRQPEQFLSEFLYPDGSQGWFELLVEAVPDGLRVLSLDISDTQRAQAQVRQTQKMAAVGRLAGGSGDDELVADLRAIRKAGERAERVTRQWLGFSRTQALVPQVIDLNTVVLDVHALLTRVIGDDIQLVLDAASGLRHTRVGPGQIEQVLMNLVVNARDAMAPGGTVRIATANATLDRPFVLAHDAWDALTLARSRSSRIDLLLTDIVRPDMNGQQIAQHVVAMHPKIRVLYVSGCPQASALGGQAISDRVSFLPKPFTQGTLLASVRDALDSWAPLQDTNVWR